MPIPGSSRGLANDIPNQGVESFMNYFFVKTFRKSFYILVTLLVGLVVLFDASTVVAKTKNVNTEQILIKKTVKRYKGDFSGMKKRGYIRVLVSYSKTNFFIEKGRIYGLEYELLKQYEAYINKRIKKRTKKIKLIFLPVHFSSLLPYVKNGLGDIAAAGLTITPQRKKMVTFTSPYLNNINEILVTNKRIKGIKSIYDLAGKTIYVRQKSSYISHLWNVNGRLKSRHKKSIKIKVLPEVIGTEDILEMVNAGALKFTVADSHIAALWAKVLPNIKVHKNIVIHKGGKIAWAIRKNNPKLRKSLNTFIKKHKKGTRMGNILFTRYYKNTKWIKNPISPKERKKLAFYRKLFEKYGKRYNFTWYMIAAQAYQESQLNPNKKSPAGAIGIMQILPKTASDKNINIKNVRNVENNIHAGVKYLNYLKRTYFSDKKISPLDRVFFSWAAYNAGPNKINSLRRIAKKRRLNPNRWFYNVEEIASEKIGRETVEYVSNITKYYIAYKLYYEKLEKKKAIKKSLKKKRK
jgi:membrane-bound lytic murein transglycosylase MltF